MLSSKKFILFLGRIKYLLNDNFTTGRAAGAVNGTNAEPTGGNRGVLDGNSKLSLSSGQLTFSTGGVASYDPTLIHTTTGYTRTTGRILVIKLNLISGRLQAGWLNNTSLVAATINAARQGSVDFNAGVLNYVSQTATGIAVGVYSTGTDYLVALIQRASGTMMLIKGGAFTNWTLCYVNSIESSATLYPYVSAIGTTGVGTSDYARIPQNIWLPTPLASDGFGSSFGTTDGLGHAEGVAGGLGAGGSGLTWSNTNSVWSVSSAKAIVTPNLGSDVVVNGGFATDTDWTKGTGWTIAGGVAVATAATGFLTAAVPPLTVGTWIQTTYTIAGYVSGTVQLVPGNIGNVARTANGTYTETQRIGTTGLLFNPTVALTATIDNVTAKALTTSEIISGVQQVFTADVMVDVAVTFVAGYQAGLCLNLDSTSNPQNFVLIYILNGNVRVDKCVAGTYTTVSTNAVTYSAGAVLRVAKIGTAYRVYYNNALVGTSNTISDAGITSNTLHGLFSTSSVNTLDNFVVYPSNSSQYSVLDKYIG